MLLKRVRPVPKTCQKCAFPCVWHTIRAFPQNWVSCIGTVLRSCTPVACARPHAQYKPSPITMAARCSELSESDFTCLLEQKIIVNNEGNWNCSSFILVTHRRSKILENQFVTSKIKQVRKGIFGSQVTDLKSWETCFMSYNIIGAFNFDL